MNKYVVGYGKIGKIYFIPISFLSSHNLYEKRTCFPFKLYDRDTVISKK
jgi:hypothetical protein